MAKHGFPGNQVYFGKFRDDYVLTPSPPLPPVRLGLRPRLAGRRRRPRRFSSWATNRLPPQGRPVLVWRRMRSTASGSSSTRSHCAQSSITPGGGNSFDSSGSSWVWQGIPASEGTDPVFHSEDCAKDGGSPTQWARALDQGWSSARSTIPARTGLRSTYRTAAHKWASSSTHE